MAQFTEGEASRGLPPIWNDDLTAQTEMSFERKQTLLFPSTYFNRLTKCSDHHVRTTIQDAILVNNFSGKDIKFAIWQLVDEAGSLNMEDLNSYIFDRKPLIKTSLPYKDACWALPVECNLDICVDLVRAPKQGHYGTSASNSVTAISGTGEFYICPVHESSNVELSVVNDSGIPDGTIRLTRDKDLGRTLQVKITQADKEIPLKNSLMSESMEIFEVRVLNKFLFCLVAYDEQQEEVIEGNPVLFDLNQSVVVVEASSAFDTIQKVLVVNKASYNIRRK
jgi:hypothetical protein